MKLASGLATIAVLFGIDQAVKIWAEASLPLHVPVDVLPFFALFRTYNTGIAFSLFSDLGDRPLIALTLAISIFVFWLWHRTEEAQWIARTGFVLVLSGAAGNLADRIRLGHVVDYILIHAGNWSFAVFNLADSFITVGAALVLIQELVQMRRGQEDSAG